MKTLNIFLLSLISSILLTGFIFGSYAGNNDNKGSSSSSSNSYVDCDDMLAECVEECRRTISAWMWLKRKKCENECLKDYYKCLEEED